MSHPGPTGNGCSLEDCYTNLFALTDLGGIKWRKLTTDHQSVEQLEDPVLVSYARCIQSGLLCVWRRVVNNSEARSSEQLSVNKELWVFWYGDEPTGIHTLLSADLRELEYGSWDKDKDKERGLSYECRTLLFKALHNLIERCLLSKNFIRLGKWFVQPYDHGSALDRSAHLSFCFNFFLHGESQVCASIEVKQHPSVWRLTPQHLRLVQDNHASFQVILAPYGLNGTLTGLSYRDADQTSRRLFEEWSQFYPLDGGNTDDKEKLPNLVEVIVAGVRMRYPSAFVLICHNEDSPVQLQPLTVQPGVASSRSQFNQSMMSNGPLTPPTSPMDASMGGGDPGVKVVPMPHAGAGTGDGNMSVNCMPNSASILGHVITQRVSEDSNITTSMAKRSMDTSEEFAAGQWHFAEPTSKVNCNCARQRKLKGGGGSQSKNFPSGKHKGDKQEKLERQQSRHGRNTTPFHRRSPVMDDLLQFDIDMVMSRMPPNPAFCPTGGTTITPQGQSTPNESNVDTPSAPSPLDEPQPLVNSTMDPPMPTLSPHPPAKSGGEKDVGCGKSGGGGSGSASETSNGMMCSGFQDVFHKTEDCGGSAVPKSEPVDSPYTHWGGGGGSRQDRTNNWLEHRLQEVNRGLKRPTLPTKESDHVEELVTDSLYNMNPVQQWINLPMKKVRIDTTPPDGSHLQQLSVLDSSSSSSPSSSSSSSSHFQRQTSKLPSPSPEPDPYEFSDEASVNPGTLARGSRKSRDEHFPRPSPILDDDSEQSRQDLNRQDSRDDRSANDMSTGVTSPQTPGTSFTRETDLKPNENDLEHIFESSGDDSDDAVGTDTVMTNSKNTEDLIAGKIGPSAQELSRMYPTPPSVNTKEASSPETMTDVTHDVVMLESVKAEAFPMPTAEELFKQGVFKLPEHGKFVDCGKYSQVELPSKQLSPIPAIPDYKPSWQYPMSIMDKSLTHTAPGQYINMPSIENIPSLTSRLPPGTVESSPATTFHNSGSQQRTPRTPRTPMSHELQSPLSNASSYLNKTLNSIDNHGTNHQLPEVHSLIVNIILSDSFLNLFKDHNFDSCNICVCNLDKTDGSADCVTGNSDGMYCSCGFNASVNRKYGHNTGLFYEDEVDITGIREDRFERCRKPSLLLSPHDDGSGGTAKEGMSEDIPQTILELLLGQFTLPCPSMVAEHRLELLYTSAATTFTGSVVDTLQIKDANEVSYNALDQGRQAMENCSPNKLEDPVMKKNCLHKWPFLKGANRIPLNSQDILRMLKTLNPLLEGAIMNERIMRVWDYSHKIQGPLSWKDFHQLAGRGSDEISEPQPIPHFLVGYERDWVSVSPFTIPYWDKQFLEPFGRQRDIVYVVVAPDNDYILQNVINFFKELSTVYELSRLGRHSPISRVLRDGIMRVGKSAAQKVQDEQVGEWFKLIGESPLAAKLKLYAQVCRHRLGPFLSKQWRQDKGMFETSSNKTPFKAPEPAKPPTPDGQNSGASSNQDENKERSGEGGSQRDGGQHDLESDDSSHSPAVVVYLIDPFTYGNAWDDDSRLAMMGLLRCYHQMVQSLPDNMQSSMCLQVVPLKTVLGYKESTTQFQTLKSMAFSVFTTCRWNMSHTIMGRPLTGFGPAAAAEMLMKKRADAGHVRLYSPPFVLAPVRDRQSQLAECCGEKAEKSSVLFVAYCLSEDQRWLLATVTDNRGQLMETCVINIEIPNRSRRKKASARKVGLQKLFDYILGIVSMTTLPARLVIGRLGRLGHGELKGWSCIISKKNLASVSKHMHEMCTQCSLVSSDNPSILSACLVSLEPQASFQLMADALKMEEKPSSQCPLQTPRDASTSHILVFPTSATAVVNSAAMPMENNPLEFDELINYEELGPTLDNDFNICDLFGTDPVTSPTGSPPLGEKGRPQDQRLNGSNPMTNGGTSMDVQDEASNLLQQPLAMGYLISTATAGPLPKWFWSACPENEYVSPTVFKAALHINSSSKQEEFMPHPQDANAHALDSHLTCDVLRFVLEHYNALSWLTYDPATNDRRSCLPIHLVVLMQMYHALNTFV